MKKLFSIVLIIIFCQFVFSQDKYDLKGTLGNLPIYMAFEDYTQLGNSQDNEITDVRYFYTTSLKDIVLRGNKVGNQFSFENDDEKIILVKNKKGEFTGTWENKKNQKKLAVNLSRNIIQEKNEPLQQKYEIIDSLIKSNDVYTYSKVGYIKLKRDSVATYKGKEFVWFSEEHCSAPYFRLGNGFSKKQLETINPILDNLHMQNILGQLSCSTEYNYSEGNGIETTIDLTYLDQNLLGFEDFSSWDCGGAHPDFGGTGYLLDLNSGKSYDINDILAFDKSVTTEEKGGFDAYSDYQEKYFAPNIVKLMINQHDFTESTDEEDVCDYTEEEYWDFPSWSYTEQGIYFTPHFYRAARGCDEPFLLPFSVLKKYKNPNFKYDFPK